MEKLCQWVDGQGVAERFLCGSPPEEGIDGWERVRTESGFGAAANGGAERATASHILFLNDDLEHRAGTIEEWVGALERRAWAFAVVGSVSGKEGEEAGTSLVRRRGRPWPAQVSRSPPGMVSYPVGSAFLVKRERWEALGGFDPAFLPAYWEDADLGLRAWGRGWGVWQTESVSFLHQGGTTTGRWPPHLLQGRFLRGQRIVAARHRELLGLPSGWWLWEGASQAGDLLRGRWRRLAVRWGLAR